VLTDEALVRERLSRYRDLLLDANQHVNLTAVREPQAVDEWLIQPSIALSALVPSSARTLLDVGSGGGVPGMILAIVRPELSVTLLDATGKKVRFLAETAAALGLKNVTTLHGRAEELGRDARYRERFDVVTARAVARLATLVELVLPFVAVGGTALLPKGASAEHELAEASEAIRLLGGRADTIRVEEAAASDTVVVRKLRRSPGLYPRGTGIPQRKPIGVPASG
jgi:16S rRNA (guanine527-N7)-methyltransferase